MGQFGVARIPPEEEGFIGNSISYWRQSRLGGIIKPRVRFKMSHKLRDIFMCIDVCHKLWHTGMGIRMRQFVQQLVAQMHTETEGDSVKQGVSLSKSNLRRFNV